jgi:hypothetical protein
LATEIPPVDCGAYLDFRTPDSSEQFETMHNINQFI